MRTERKKYPKLLILLYTLTMAMFFFPAAVRAEKEEALQTAKDYLQTMPFSRSGLIDQLTFAGFSAEEAEYAADNSGADWNEMAVLSARSYLDNSDYSEKGLISLLESSSEGFTHEQAVYGASRNGY